MYIPRRKITTPKVYVKSEDIRKRREETLVVAEGYKYSTVVKATSALITQGNRFTITQHSRPAIHKAEEVIGLCAPRYV